MKHFQLFKNINPLERYFLFTDGSTRKDASPPVIGLGAELRDNNGELIFTYSEEILIENLPSNISPNSSEQLALIKALNICINENIKILVVNTDSSGLSTKLTSFLEEKFLNSNDYHNLLINTTEINKEIFNLADKFEEIFIEYIPRELNKYADFYSRSVAKLVKNHALIHYSNTNPINLKQYSKNQIQIIKNINNKLGVKPLSSPKDFEKTNILQNVFLKRENKNSSKNSSSNSKHHIPTIVQNFLKTKSSIIITDIKNFDKHYAFRNEEKILNIDVQDYKENVSVRFFFGNYDNKKPYEFKSLWIEKNGQNVYLPLLFIIYNLMTEASDIDLKHSFDLLNKFFIFDYSHKMWQSIYLHKNTYLKTRAFIHKNMLLNIQKFLKSPNLSNLLGKYYNCFSDVILNNQHKFYLHHTHNNQQLYMNDASIAAANAASILLNKQKQMLTNLN